MNFENFTKMIKIERNQFDWGYSYSPSKILSFSNKDNSILDFDYIKHLQLETIADKLEEYKNNLKADEIYISLDFPPLCKIENSFVLAIKFSKFNGETFEIERFKIIHYDKNTGNVIGISEDAIEYSIINKIFSVLKNKNNLVGEN